MAAARTSSLSLSDPDETALLAVRLAPLLQPGDVVLLNGDVGAGKTHFARALIQSLLDPVEDVPSPTFTLIQTYDGRSGEIWHADLYRLTSTLEIEELGLIGAMETAICLIEWPDRLGPLLPPDALTLNFAATDDLSSRQLTAQWTSPKWTAKWEAATA